MKGHQRLQGIGMTSLRTRERLVERLIEQGIQRIDVLETLRDVPRHLFIDEALAHRAYEDVSLPIGFGQTISQPYIVARMTEVLMNYCTPDAVILEIGTGCGYQTAVLSRLARQVYSVERIAPLQQRARRTLADLGYHNVFFQVSDGSFGWSRHAPYQGILAAAAADQVPPYLVRQLDEGGVLVMPVGEADQQELRVYRREGDQLHMEALEPVCFVPFLTGVVRE